MSLVTGFILTMLSLAAYFLPTIVAARRHHCNDKAILMLNILLGWTFLGWVIALVWALTANVRPAEQPVILVRHLNRHQRGAGLLVENANRDSNMPPNP